MTLPLGATAFRLHPFGMRPYVSRFLIPAACHCRWAQQRARHSRFVRAALLCAPTTYDPTPSPVPGLDLRCGRRELEPRTLNPDL